MLLISQKNLIYDIIESKGLSPNLFKVSETKEKGGSITSIRYSEEFVFTIYYIQNGWSITYSPADSRFSQSMAMESWYEITRCISLWLDYLKREITQIDKWKRLEEQIGQVNISYPHNNDNFSAHEYEELKIRMRLLKGRLNEIDFTAEQLEALNSKIDHLTELAVNLNKFDWNGLFVGTLISIIIQLGITQENAKSLWSLIKTIFNPYFLQ